MWIGCGRRRRQVRNREWFHMIADHVISMPDKWEYPWFAAWDLAFHALALSSVDIDFAKQQINLLLDQALPASDRTDPGLRVELQRCQSAGACLGSDLLSIGWNRRCAARPTWIS